MARAFRQPTYAQRDEQRRIVTSHVGSKDCHGGRFSCGPGDDLQSTVFASILPLLHGASPHYPAKSLCGARGASPGSRPTSRFLLAPWSFGSTGPLDAQGGFMRRCPDGCSRRLIGPEKAVISDLLELIKIHNLDLVLLTVADT